MSGTVFLCCDDRRRAALQETPALNGIDFLEVADLLPDTDALRWTFHGGRVVLRPSGTEPKLKAYLQVVVPDGSRAIAEAQMAELRSEVADRLGQPSE